MRPERALTINGGPPRAGLEEVERALGGRLPDGDYWYDKACGVWGPWGGPAAGFLPAGLDIAGPLPHDASGGQTPVIVNGRALHPTDVFRLNQVLMKVGGQCLPGRWFMDAQWNMGPEGGFPLLNLGQLMMSGGGLGGGGDNFWSTGFSAGNSSGGAGYVSLPGGGFATYGM